MDERVFITWCDVYQLCGVIYLFTIFVIACFNLMSVIPMCINTYKCLTTRMQSPRRLYPKINVPRLVLQINLPFSDLMMCVCSFYITAMMALEAGNYKWCTRLCNVTHMLQYTFAFISSATIAAIGFGRYIYLIQTLGDHSSRVCHSTRFLVCWSIILFACIWIGALALTFPLLLYENLDDDVFVSEWPVKYLSTSYTFVFVLMQFILPVVILNTSSIPFFSYMHYLGMNNESAPDETAERTQIRQSLVASTVVFATAWFPLNGLIIFNEFIDIMKDQENFLRFIYCTCHVFALMSTIMNTSMYGWFNQEVREEFTQLMTPLRSHLLDIAYRPPRSRVPLRLALHEYNDRVIAAEATFGNNVALTPISA